MVGPTGNGLWVGEDGASAFTRPFIDYSFRPNRMPSFLDRIHGTGDDRSFVIVSVVVLERYLDVLLEGLLPGYDDLVKKREFTLSLKLGLLNALRLIPPHIVQIADLMRRVRNEFAHNLDCDKLENLKNSLKVALAQRVGESYGDAKPYSSSHREMFKALTFLALVGLESYRVNVAVLRERMDDGSLSESLKLECEKRHRDKVNSLSSQAPKRIVEKDGWRYKYFDLGVVAIEPIDPDNPPTTVNLDPRDLL